MKKFIDMVFEKKVLVAVFVTVVVLLCGFAKHHQEKAALQKEIENLILEGLTPWFHPKSLQHVKGKSGVYILEDQIDEKVADHVNQWNDEGCTAFLDLKKLAEYSIEETCVKEGDVALKKKIVDQINEDVPDKEKNEALRFMVEGRTADTGYESVLEIEGELFLDCVLDLNHHISEALKLKDFEVDIRKEWINTLEGSKK